MARYIAQLIIGCALGETRTFTGTHQTSETDTTPIPIAGWTIATTIRNAGDISVRLVGTVTSGPLGTYTWTIVPANTVTLGVGDCEVETWRTDTGSETLMANGTFSIVQEVRV